MSRPQSNWTLPWSVPTEAQQETIMFEKSLPLEKRPSWRNFPFISEDYENDGHRHVRQNSSVLAELWTYSQRFCMYARFYSLAIICRSGAEYHLRKVCIFNINFEIFLILMEQNNCVLFSDFRRFWSLTSACWIGSVSVNRENWFLSKQPPFERRGCSDSCFLCCILSMGMKFYT